MSDLSKKVVRDIAGYFFAAMDGSPLSQAHLIGNGPVAELESKIASHYGATYALCVPNATLGLLCVGLACGLRDDAFITTPLTFGGSLSGLLTLNNRPIFADVDQHLTLSATAVERVLRAGQAREARAMLSVDIFGNPSDSRRLRGLADRYGLVYIADCAQSLGARRAGRPASAEAHVLVTSFGLRKTLPAGEGGAIVTNDRTLYERLLTITQHPLRQKRELGLDRSDEFGINARIHPVAAIWANLVFDEALAALSRRQATYAAAISILNESGLIEPIRPISGRGVSAFFCLPVKLRPRVRVQQILELLALDGIEFNVGPLPVSLIYTNPVFKKTYRAQYAIPRHCRNAERVSRHLALTLWSG